MSIIKRFTHFYLLALFIGLPVRSEIEDWKYCQLTADRIFLAGDKSLVDGLEGNGVFDFDKFNLRGIPIGELESEPFMVGTLECTARRAQSESREHFITFEEPRKFQFHRKKDEDEFSEMGCHRILNEFESLSSITALSHSERKVRKQMVREELNAFDPDKLKGVLKKHLRQQRPAEIIQLFEYFGYNSPSNSTNEEVSQETPSEVADNLEKMKTLQDKIHGLTKFLRSAEIPKEELGSALIEEYQPDTRFFRGEFGWVASFKKLGSGETWSPDSKMHFSFPQISIIIENLSKQSELIEGFIQQGKASRTALRESSTSLYPECKRRNERLKDVVFTIIKEDEPNLRRTVVCKTPNGVAPRDLEFSAAQSLNLRKLCSELPSKEGELRRQPTTPFPGPTREAS